MFIFCLVDAITPTANANGEYFEVSNDKTQLTAYLKYFSTYAIAYSDSAPAAPSTSSRSGSASNKTIATAQITGLPYYVDDKGKDVFIGFSTDADGTMKYIAPAGQTVLLKGPTPLTSAKNRECGKLL